MMHYSHINGLIDQVIAIMWYIRSGNAANIFITYPIVLGKIYLNLIFVPGKGVRNDIHEMYHSLLGVGVLIMLPKVIQYIVTGLQYILVYIDVYSSYFHRSSSTL